MQSVSSGVLPEMNKAPYRRRRYFLPGTSQPRLLLTVQGILALLGVLVAAVLYVLFNRDLTASYLSAHLAIRNVRDMLLPTLAAIDVGVFVLSAVLMLFYTHRIAGPAYRLGRTLREVAAGRLPSEVRLRKGDYLEDLAAETNHLLAALREEAHSLEQDVLLLEAALAPLENGLPPEEREALRAALGRVRAHAERFSPPEASAPRNS